MFKCSYIALLLFGIYIFLGNHIIAQNTRVKGTIYESGTTETLPFVKIYYLGTQVGTTSNADGNYELSISNSDLHVDSIVVSFLGFKTQKIKIEAGLEQEIDIHLESTLFVNMGEVTVVAGENPAWHYMRKLIEHKDKNNPDNLESYSSQEYSKIRFDLNNFTDKIKKNLIFRPFDYIWDNTQETEDGINYLPMLMTEKVIEHYVSKSPNDKKDVIIGEKTTGLAGPSLVKFTGDLYLTPNIYDNYVDILGKSFPSPLNSNYKMNYKFYLQDSTGIGATKTYKISFRPKHERELGFTGEMYFDSTSYAVKEINLRFDFMANVNFVRSYFITQKYSKVSGDHWMLKESTVVGDFTVVENSSDLTGFFGRKRATHSNYEINKSIDSKLLKGPELFIYLDSAQNRSEDFWNLAREVELTQEEDVLLQLTKRVVEDPAFVFRKNAVYMFRTRFIPMNAIQMGEYTSFFSYNPIETYRTSLGFRTNPENRFPWHFTGYVASNLGDRRIKYSIHSFVNLTTDHVTRLGASYTYDLMQIGRSFNQVRFDHALSSLTQLGDSEAWNYLRNFEGYFEKSITTGFVARLSYFNHDYSPTSGNLYPAIDSNGDLTLNENYIASGMEFTIKFSHLNNELSGSFYDREDLTNKKKKFPDVAFSYAYSDKNVFASHFDYQKLKLSARQNVNAKKLGYFKYNIEVGKTIGTVPHMLLDIPFGNQLVLADEYSFNLMKFMEFASDQYAAVHLEHHFDGLILNRIPLINKLKWRSFIFGKAFFGSISKKNNQSNYIFPGDLIGIEDAYYEVGFGIENIFKIAKMDFVWRITPGVGEYYSFLVKPSFKISF